MLPNINNASNWKLLEENIIHSIGYPNEETTMEATKAKW